MTVRAAEAMPALRPLPDGRRAVNIAAMPWSRLFDRWKGKSAAPEPEPEPDGNPGVDYLPSTRRLLDLLMHRPWVRPGNLDEARDPDPVDACLTEWENEVLSRLPGDQYRTGLWPASPELLAALRDALADQRGNYAGERLAFALARCGCHDPEVVAALDPWEALVFRWRAAGYSAEQLLVKLQAAGAAGRPAAEDVQQLNRWLADPVTALHAGTYVFTILLSGRHFVASLYDNGGEPDYGGLLSAMAAHAVPPLPVKDISQATDAAAEVVTGEVHSDLGDAIPAELRDVPVFRFGTGNWKVGYQLDGVPGLLKVRGDSSWVNDSGLLATFNALLAGLGRPDRVIKFGKWRGDGGFTGEYIVADPGLFVPLCQELGVPLATTGAEPV